MEDATPKRLVSRILCNRSMESRPSRYRYCELPDDLTNETSVQTTKPKPIAVPDPGTCSKICETIATIRLSLFDQACLRLRLPD